MKRWQLYARGSPFALRMWLASDKRTDGALQGTCQESDDQRDPADDGRGLPVVEQRQTAEESDGGDDEDRGLQTLTAGLRQGSPSLCRSMEPQHASPPVDSPIHSGRGIDHSGHRRGGGKPCSFPGSSCADLPASTRNVVIGAYNDALTPVFLYMVPLILLAVVMLCFIKEKPLATTIEGDILPGTLEIDGMTNCHHRLQEDTEDGSAPDLRKVLV